MKVLKKMNFLIIVVSTMLVCSCRKLDVNKCVVGEGAIITQVLELSEFNKIDTKGSFDVTVIQGETQEVKVIGYSNIISNLNTSVFNNLWSIEYEEGCYRDSDLRIQITIPNIELIRVTGSGNVLVKDFINQSVLENTITGSGNITLNKLDGLTDLSTTITGSGSLKANNDISTLEDLDVNISGSGRYYGFGISSDKATVKLSGSGKAQLIVVNNLNVTVSGSGNVSYKGTPMIQKSITGSGRLINAN